MTQFSETTIDARGRLHPLRAALLLLGVAAMAAFITTVEHAVLYGLVAMLALLWCVPIWFQWYRGELDYFEPIHVLGFVYLVYFGLGAIWTVNDPQRVAYDRYVIPYVPEAVLYCLLGYGMLLLGYYGPWKERQRRRGEEEYPTGALFVIVPGVLGFIGFLAQVLWYRAAKLGVAISGLFSSLGQLAPLFVFAWALSWLLFFSRRSTRGERWLLFGAYVPAAGLIVLNSMNNKSMIVSLAAVPLMSLWYARRRIPWVTLIVLLLIVVFVIFPFNNTYRTLDNRISTSTRLSMTADIIAKWDTDRYLDRSLGTFKARMAMINSMGVVVRDVGRWVPFAHGRTIFLPTLTFFIPRVLWPDKPAMTMGREFGETFRVVHVLDHETNMAATVPGELYWNFGVPGVLLGMALWGVGLRYYYRRYGESEELDPVRRAIHLVTLIQVLHFEAAIAAPLVMLVRTLLVLEAYRLLSRRFKLLRVVRTPASTSPGTAG